MQTRPVHTLLEPALLRPSGSGNRPLSWSARTGRPGRRAGSGSEGRLRAPVTVPPARADLAAAPARLTRQNPPFCMQTCRMSPSSGSATRLGAPARPQVEGSRPQWAPVGCPHPEPAPATCHHTVRMRRTRERRARPSQRAGLRRLPRPAERAIGRVGPDPRAEILPRVVDAGADHVHASPVGRDRHIEARGLWVEAVSAPPRAGSRACWPPASTF